MNETSIGMAYIFGVASAVFCWTVFRWRRRRYYAKCGGKYQRRASDRRLETSDKLAAFDHVTQSGGIGVFSWDMEKDEIVWSDIHYAMFGYPAGATVTYQMFVDRIFPDDLEGLESAIQTAIATRSDYAHRFRILLPDGAIRHIQGSGRIASGPDGKAQRMNGAVIDVTELTEAQEASSQHQADLATVAANLPDVISRFDKQLRRVFVSPAIEQLTGKKPAHFLGKTHAELGGDSVLASRWRAILEDVIRNRREREFDFTFADQYGRERFFITRAIPSFDQTGAVESILTIATDHTEREMVARRLRSDGEVLERADARKNEYLATLAHELRGPLAPISAAVTLMKLSDRRETWIKSQQVIERQVAQLAELVDDLMEVGRISSGKMVIHTREVALQDILQAAVESVRPVTDTKYQQLSVKLPEDAIRITADPTRLTQVFANLLTNSSKYSPENARIAVTAKVEGGRAVVDVLDNGIGLTDASMVDIFEMFSQVHPTGVHAQGGLGIGLSLVRQLVALHGGEVSVASEGLGKGSRFSVSLPVSSSAAPIAASVAAREVSDSARLRVLVVDDNVDGASTLAALLEAMGHEALVANNGRDAIRIASESALDLILLDLGLPDIGGVEVALTIRGKPWGKQVRIVALTGLGRPEDRFMTESAGFNAHLVKPIKMDDLQALLAAGELGTKLCVTGIC